MRARTDDPAGARRPSGAEEGEAALCRGRRGGGLPPPPGRKNVYFVGQRKSSGKRTPCWDNPAVVEENRRRPVGTLTSPPAVETITAKLALEDGSVFRGESIGAEGSSVGEVVFNTSLSGYQEIFTDPSYNGQMVVMTNPLIGNYGINPEDEESFRPH